MQINLKNNSEMLFPKKKNSPLMPALKNGIMEARLKNN
jgi:hypothetical protein